MPSNTDNSGSARAARLRRIAASQGPVPANSKIGSQALDTVLGKAECCPASTCIPNSNLVLNGDFATGDFTDWNREDGNNNEIASGEPLPSPAGAQYGYVPANINSNTSLIQNISTTVGQTYTLSYYLFDTGGVTGGEEEEDGGTVYFSASVSDTPITGSIISYTTPPANPGLGWTLYSFVFTATSNSTLLTFTTRHDPSYFFLTNISVTAPC